LFLSACSTLPQPTEEADAGSRTPWEPESRYTLRAPRGGNPSLGPLSELTTESSLGLRIVAPLTATDDLWERIRRGFAMPDLDNPLVRDREEWYSARTDYMLRMTERSSKYLFHIVEELERRNMPTELALLPFIESAFNPQAVSNASAAGMWQFMPATGKDFDLKQNMFRDDRRDVLASTRAALDYLERLYRQFGDWHLALAAYNWGPGSVTKAVKRNQGLGLGTGYSQLTLPQETRYYVPKLQAVKNIVADPQRYGARLPRIGNHPFFDAVPIKHDIDVAKVAQLAGVSERDLRLLNPSANKPLILAAATPSVLLPWDNAAQFEARLSNYSGPLSSWTAWKAPRDMTVAQAAAQHDIGENELREINKIPPRMLVKAGSTLLVPRNGKLDVDVPGHLADHGQLLLEQEIELVRTLVRAHKGETVAKLAQRFRVSADKVAEWNQLSTAARLKPGQSLVLHLPRRAAAAAATAPTAAKARKGTVVAGHQRTAAVPGKVVEKKVQPHGTRVAAAPRKR
jgi:membrane-bound lytic murein transglycosylase D